MVKENPLGTCLATLYHKENAAAMQTWTLSLIFLFILHLVIHSFVHSSVIMYDAWLKLLQDSSKRDSKIDSYSMNL